MDETCDICRFIDDLAVKADAYALPLYQSFADTLITIWAGLLLASILVFIILILLGAAELKLSTIVGKALLAIFVTMALYSTSGTVLDVTFGRTVHDPPLVWQWTYEFIRDITTGFAQAMLTGASDVRPPEASSAGPLASPFARLFGTMELSIMRVIYVGADIMTSRPMDIGIAEIPNISAVVIGLILLLPYIFVVGLFSAYIIESLFGFLAVICVAPILVVSLFWRNTRKFAMTGLNLMLAAGLTLVFAGIAMGFTLSITDQYLHEFACLIAGDVNAVACQALPPGQATANVYQQIADGGINGHHLIYTPQYWTCLFIGFMSILLHIKAKTIATNFAGVQDGAGPAAAVVAATKLATLGAIGTTLAQGRNVAGGSFAGLGALAGGRGSRLGNILTEVGYLAGGRGTKSFIDRYRRGGGGGGEALGENLPWLKGPRAQLAEKRGRMPTGDGGAPPPPPPKPGRARDSQGRLRPEYQ